MNSWGRVAGAARSWTGTPCRAPLYAPRTALTDSAWLHTPPNAPTLKSTANTLVSRIRSPPPSLTPLPGPSPTDLTHTPHAPTHHTHRYAGRGRPDQRRFAVRECGGKIMHRLRAPRFWALHVIISGLAVGRLRVRGWVGPSRGPDSFPRVLRTLHPHHL